MITFICVKTKAVLIPNANGCVIGAGTVVTKDIPDSSLVLGVPGKVIRPITEKDRLGNFPY